VRDKETGETKEPIINKMTEAEQINAQKKSDEEFFKGLKEGYEKMPTFHLKHTKQQLTRDLSLLEQRIGALEAVLSKRDDR
jgi:Ethanolamine utilization protein EutJ (predicted chaperonin)